MSEATGAEKITPNVKRLIIHKMSVDAVPAGGGLATALDYMMKPGGLANGLKEARTWVMNAINAVRGASEPNPWKDADDETIATELMRKVDERKAART
jgi:hypothetical protein